MILEIKIKRNNGFIALVQSHYVENLLKKFDYFNQKPISTPYNSSVKLVNNNGRCINQLQYSRIVCNLIYLMHFTRPVITFAIGMLSRFTSNPSNKHWEGISRVSRYLKEMIDYGYIMMVILLF